MKLIKESDYLEIKVKSIVVMTCRIDRLTLVDAAADKVINDFLKEISDNVKEYALSHLAEKETELYKADTSRQKRLYIKAVPFVFSVRGEIVSDKYLNVEMITDYREQKTKKQLVFSTEDGRIENVGTFCKVKKYLNDDFKLGATQVSIMHKGKTVKINRDDIKL